MELELANVEELEKLHSQEPITIEQMKTDLNRLTSFIREILKKDQDYGVIPGTGKKPTLYKTGAEKLLKFFRYTPRFHLVEKITNWDPEKPFFYFNYCCTIHDRITGKVVAEANGSCNSREKKYAYKSQYDPKKPPEPQPSVYTFSIVNTLEKMAQKRAFVGATLIATCASMFFTQDLEDMKDVLEAEYEIIEEGTTSFEENNKYEQKKVEKKITENQRTAILNMLGHYVKPQEGETPDELETRKEIVFQEINKAKKPLNELTFDEASAAIKALGLSIKEDTTKKKKAIKTTSENEDMSPF
jgi:hypothetical protein